MGGKFKKRGRGGGKKDGAKQYDNNPKRDEDAKWKYQNLERKELASPSLDAYYALQTKVTNPEEWAQILTAFKQPLPVTFRVNNSNVPETQRIVSRIRELRTVCNPTMPENAKLNEVEWFPGDGMCWETKMSKRELSKGADGMKTLHEFLVTETERGNLSRQEVVSMIPPLFLDVQSHHLVLDCCAAPGSKTTQIMEDLSRTSSGDITGCLIANDMDPKRCDVLVKQTHRLREVYPNAIITNHNAALFPFPHVMCEPKEGEAPSMQRTQFDRILADVVCSGDGTLRKSLDLWDRWSPILGNAVHKPQVQILLRAMDLLKEGGRIVYSTCSMNPVEDEAVLNHCMRTSKHTFKLVDCSDMLPELKREPGVNEWVVCDKEMTQAYRKWSDVTPDDAKKYKLTESMFASEDIARYNMQHSMRFKPHTHDTGGFFVAVLEKVTEGFPENLGRITTVATDGTTWIDMVKAGDKRIKSQALEHSMFRTTPEESETIRSALALTEDFPLENLFCRRTGAGAVRKAFLFAPLAQRILEASNHKPVAGDFWPAMRVVTGGLRVAEKNSGNMGMFRVSQEATAMLCKYTTRSKLREVQRPVLASLLSASVQPWMYELEEADPAQKELIDELADGTCTLKLVGCGDDPRNIISCVVRKFGAKIHLWADRTEVERLRIALGMPIDGM